MVSAPFKTFSWFLITHRVKSTVFLGNIWFMTYSLTASSVLLPVHTLDVSCICCLHYSRYLGCPFTVITVKCHIFFRIYPKHYLLYSFCLITPFCLFYHHVSWTFLYHSTYHTDTKWFVMSAFSPRILAFLNFICLIFGAKPDSFSLFFLFI